MEDKHLMMKSFDTEQRMESKQQIEINKDKYDQELTFDSLKTNTRLEYVNDEHLRMTNGREEIFHKVQQRMYNFQDKLCSTLERWRSL